MQPDSHPTKLAAWLANAPVTMKEVAARAGISPEHLRNVAVGVRGCTYDVAARISTATGGVVGLGDILGEEARAAVRRRRRARRDMQAGAAAE